ncbi:MAG TPA: hypothetical protein PLT25_08575 [Acidocella sp.]|nr:hypothetical protein [Acidocella sp.]
MTRSITKNGVTAHKDPKLPPLPHVSDGPDWTNILNLFNPEQATLLVATVQTLYPHRGVAPTVYRRVVVNFDKLASQTPSAARLSLAFCDKLSAASPVSFTELAETYRISALKTIETTPEFIFVQRMSVRYLYDDLEIWASFGYEGASYHLGGYIKRGFDDLNWLPPLPNDL